MSSSLRLVLDTNVVLSALVFGGGPAGRLRLAWQQGVFVPLASTATAREQMRVLCYPKFRLSLQEQEELLGDYLPHTHAVRIPQPPPSVPACRDVMDLPFMQLAVAGSAQVLVSGDRDLLTLSCEFVKTFACSIVTLDEFVRSRIGA